jgi:hypothetical protein
VRNAAGALIVALLLTIAFTHAATATETEADAIRGVVDAWIADGDTLNNPKYLEDLDAMYGEASPACKSFIDLVFAGIAIFDIAQRYSPDHIIGQESYTLVVTPFAEREYACRIAI